MPLHEHSEEVPFLHRFLPCACELQVQSLYTLDASRFVRGTASFYDAPQLCLVYADSLKPVTGESLTVEAVTGAHIRFRIHANSAKHHGRLFRLEMRLGSHRREYSEAAFKVKGKLASRHASLRSARECLTADDVLSVLADDDALMTLEGMTDAEVEDVLSDIVYEEEAAL